MKRVLNLAETGIILLIALAPVFASFPYRINIFLSWEGAYRMAEGQIPYRDFGMPVGYMYWVIPALFFKIFGVQMITLIKAQAFINILAGFAFRSIFRSLGINTAIRFCAVIVFCLSYTFFNYWPWYNHTVIVYELIALAFLFKFLVAEKPNKGTYLYPVLAGAFVFFAFFTKQDGGGLALLVCLALLLYHSLVNKKWAGLLVFIAATVVTGLVVIVPLMKYNFGYWFNHGQPPHSSRISIVDILKEFFQGSQWIKFYLLVIALVVLTNPVKWKEQWKNQKYILFLLLTLGILAEAAIFQVTSYVPVDNNIFFHSFAFAFILYALANRIPISFDSWKPVVITIAGVFLWWSSVYWKYVERFVLKPDVGSYTTTRHNGYDYADVVNKNTFMIELDTTAIPLSEWRTPAIPVFQKILLPGPTVDGIERLMKLPEITKKDPIVLNMTELTPLAAAVPFKLESGPEYPLWFHKGVALFEKELNLFTGRIKNNYYDLVLYEYIPYLNNFNPYKVRETLMENYQKIDSFPAPRNPSAQAWVEVYRRK